MQVKSTNRMFRSRERRVANRSFLNSCERPSALATAVATPILSKSCMSRNSRSTALFFHDLRESAQDSAKIGGRLGLGRGKPRRCKRANIQAGSLSQHQVRHDLCRDWGQQDTVAKM